MKLPRRILIKLSGELLRDSSQETYTSSAIDRVCSALQNAVTTGVELGVVIGAGNLFRGIGSNRAGVQQIVGDQVGMLGTIMNALVVRDALSRKGIVSHVMAPQPTFASVLPVDPLKAKEFLLKGEVVLFAGGTGNPYFTTDSAAALRALEIGASVLVKATKVSGVYSKDPTLFPEATRYQTITYDEVLQQKLAVMDHTAVALAMQHDLSVFVYKFGTPPSITEALQSDGVGTYIVTNEHDTRR